jgi:hypothetical protein
MSPALLLVALRARGVTLAATDQQLAVEAPPGTLTAADLDALRAHKADVLALLGDLESLERDGTARLWRNLYEQLAEGERERLAAEVASGDPIGCLLALALDGTPL